MYALVSAWLWDWAWPLAYACRAVCVVMVAVRFCG